MFTDSSQHYRDDVRCQLRSRLRVSAILLLIGTVAFLVRFLLVGIAHEPISPTILTAHVSLIAILGVSALILCGRCNIALGKLRIAEVIIFGAPAAFFVWAPYCRFCEVEQPNLLMVGSFLAQITIPWMILIQIYSVYIPNTARRTAAVVGAMAVLPLGSAWILGNRHPQLNELLFQLGGFSAISLWIVLSAIIAVYGAARFGRLNREAFDAQRLGTYILRDKLGSGGMGEVYLAEHRLLKRKCAIKLIRDEKAGDPQAIARFETEVRSSARLTHPNTIEIYDYGHTDDGTFYYVMEYLPGINLQEMVERFGPLPPERVVHLLLPVTSALREAHDAGLIHRDIKPGNIFASERGGMRDVPKLLDFGLVKTLFPRAIPSNSRLKARWWDPPCSPLRNRSWKANLTPAATSTRWGRRPISC